MKQLNAPNEIYLIPKKPKILVLAPRYPYPVVGGDRLRIYEICKELANECDITLLSLCDQKREMTALLPDDNVFRSIHRIYLPKWKSYLNSALALLGDEPIQVSYYSSRLFRNELVRLLPAHDLVLAHLLRTGDYVKNSPIPSVVEMTDAISLNYFRSKLLRKEASFRSRVYAAEADRLSRYEKSAVDRHDLLCFVSKIDAKYLYGDPLPKNILICSNGVDTSSFKFEFKKKSSAVVAFIGNMVSHQNQDAAFWFASEVLPLLRCHGDFRFRIVGQIPDKARVKFNGLEGVEMTGLVPAVADAVRDCFAGVCPVRIGAGVQNKLLEYMALGLPAVTTSIGLEGLGARDREELFVADSPADFSERVLDLWTDRSNAERLAANARRYVEADHSWSAMLAPLVDRIKNLAEVARKSHD